VAIKTLKKISISILKISFRKNWTRKKRVDANKDAYTYSPHATQVSAYWGMKISWC